MNKEDELKIAYQVYEYRKLGMRWCKLEKMFNMSYRKLRGLFSVYKAHLEKNTKKSI